MKLSKFNTRALLANIAIWTTFIAVNLSAFIIDSSREGRQVDVLLYLKAYTVSFGPWMAATPVFYYFLNQTTSKISWSIPTTALVLFFFWFPFAFVFESISFSIMRPSADKGILEVGLSLPVWYWVYHAMLFSATVGICISLIFYRRSNQNKLKALKATQENVELELQLSELRMKSLQTQLEPHFLFNALNAISSLVRISEKQEALNAIKKLSDLLRYAVESSDKLFVPFDNELEFVKDYVALQTIRFEEKLSVNIQDLRKGKNQECPPFLLQIFVENAVRHGLERGGDKMSLVIQISDENERLILMVENDLQQGKKNTETLGIGLSNLRSRLDIIYKTAVEFSQETINNHYRIHLAIPANQPNDS